ncbi:MAG: hypothetical protein ACSHXD_15225 [Marinosulfonomonas sp.]
MPDAAPATKWQEAPDADIAVHEDVAMIKNPAMAGPFIKSLTVMGSVPRG